MKQLNEPIWDIKEGGLAHRQRRRAEVTRLLLEPNQDDLVLDTGCGEGFQLSYITTQVKYAVGIDISSRKIKIANDKVRSNNVSFLRASCERLPFKNRIFSKIMCLEVLEHLRCPEKTVKEIDRCLKKKGLLVVSVPFKEKVILTTCIHCGKLTPLYGHLHVLDEEKITSIMPRNYEPLRFEHLPTLISRSPKFRRLPLGLWMIINNFSKKLFKTYWFIAKFKKS